MKLFEKVIAVSLFSLLFAGCQLLTPSKKEVALPKASPRPSASPVASVSATPTATISANPKQSSGFVLGATTKQASVVQPKPTNSPVLYDVSFDRLEVTNFPGQTQNATLILKNDSDETALWFIKLNSNKSSTYPVSVNDTNEVTGSIPAHGTTNVTVNTMSSDNPLFSTSFTVVFSTQNAVVAKQDVKVTIHTPVSEMVHVTTTDDANLSIAFVSNGSFRVWIENKHGQNLNWSASLEQGGDKLRMIAPSGYFLKDTSAFFPVYFTTTDRGGFNQAKIVFTYTDDDHKEVAKHTLLLNIQ